MKKLIPLYIISSILIIYFIMFVNTNSIVYNVKNIMIGNVDGEITANTPLDRYNIVSRFPNAKVKANVTRLFTWHNFFDGYMWVIYSYETEENDQDIKPGTWNVISKWKIHRENGEWKVIDIEESP